ncbi:MAG TPA: glycosyltransferase family 39 protein [Bacteroidales bacterium]|nr:glycosyltransferase family 39 protein [Bacteroidales bacterium]
MKFSHLTDSFKTTYFRWIVMIMLFIPLLFISNRRSHDWGDDFAQYIHQAKNIVQGIPQSETGFVYSQENFIGPKAYPVGFPLLLSPVYAVFGNNMKAFTTYISVFYFILALLLVLFFRKYFSLIPSVVLAMILLYNPQMMLFKQEVMSDLPFTVLLVASMLLYMNFRKNNTVKIILVLIAGLMITVRPIGFVFLIAVLIDQVVMLLKEDCSRRRKFYELVVATVFVLLTSGIYLLLNVAIFRIPSGGGLNNYLAYFGSGEIVSTILTNLRHYSEVFQNFYTPSLGDYDGFSLLSGVLFLAMAMVGLLKRFTTRIEFLDIFFLIYLVILLVFPNNASAFRLMVPVSFLLLLYVATGFRSLSVLPSVSGKLKAAILGILILAFYMPGIRDIISTKYIIMAGPQKAESEQAFDYIRENVPENAVIMFVKPRALSLYAGRAGFADPAETDMTKFHKQVVDAGVNYFLLNNDISSEASKRYLRVMNERVDSVWSNETFGLYRLKSFNP